MKIKWPLILSVFLLTTTQVFAAISEPVVAKSTTYVLQRANIPQSSYEIGMGVGKLSPYTKKAWKVNTAPELAYLLSGQVIISTKNHGNKTTTAGHSYKPPINILHQTKAGSEGMVYVVVWGKQKGKPITKGRSGSGGSRKEINLRLISQISKRSTSLVNINSKLHVLETGHIPQSPYEISLAKGTLAPNVIKPWHKYSTPKIFYILNGEIKLTVKGYPTKKYIFGDSFKIPPNVFYQIKAGSAGVAYLVVLAHKQLEINGPQK